MESTGHDELGDILAVFAHPDDEAYLAGALMAAGVDGGRRVACVTATYGELGFPDDDPRSVEERKAVRAAELAACLGILGVTEHHWLGYPDGGCLDVDDDEPVGRLLELLDEVRPDTVLTFGPDGQTYHDDHITVGRWTTLAHRARGGDAGRLLYAAMTPDWVAAFSALVDVREIMMRPDLDPPVVEVDELALRYLADGELLDRKVRALQAQASQTGDLIAQMGIDGYASLVGDESFRVPRPDDFTP